ncbi:MAG: thiamine-phosphate kinase [Flavobacteriia bacterium]|nr:thiamine-phosphate kinase [Flavobacteriia bacterium]
MNEKRTDINELGEFALIDTLTKKFTSYHNETIKGVGDDAAVISISEKEALLISTDTLIEGIHFDLQYTPLKHLGYKAVTVNLSDIYAMNGNPQQITVSIAISNRFSVEAIEEIYEGIKKACDWYEIDLIGGDTSSSTSGLILTITAIGRVEKNRIAFRSTAKENDLLVVSGDLGAAYLGLQLLEREKQIFNENPDLQPDLDGYDYLLERQLKPEARKDIIAQLYAFDIIPTSMIDISDGLASEIMHLCQSSQLGCNVYEDKIPLDPKTCTTALDFNISPVTAAMNGGEDYELLFSVRQSDYEKLITIKELQVIGHFTAKDNGIYLIDKQNQIFPIKAQGWKHF